MYKELGLDVSFKPGHKYRDLLAHFTDKIPEGVIQLNKKVKKVTQDGDVVRLTLEDGKELEADYVIHTPSLGVLKWATTDGDVFQPRLSEKKIKAIETTGFGTVGKVYLRYVRISQCFPNSFETFNDSFLHRYDNVWWSPDEFEGFAFLYDSPSNYTEADADADWTRSALGIYAIAHKPDVLQLWIAGAGARKMETLTDEQVKADVVALMEKFLRKSYPDMVAEPSDILVSSRRIFTTIGLILIVTSTLQVTRWHSNPLVRGSYSHQTVESVRMDAMSEMFEPEMGGRLRFAGEATHPTFSSTVHGAIEAGWREAREILTVLGIEAGGGGNNTPGRASYSLAAVLVSIALTALFL